MECNPGGVTKGRKITKAEKLMEILRRGEPIYFESVPLGIEYAVFEAEEYGQVAFEYAMDSLQRGKLFECKLDKKGK